MSFILDALRRAEAERQQGQVPGLNAGPAVPAAMGLPSTRRRPGLAAWLVPAALLLAGAAWWWSRPAPAPVVAVAPAPTASPQPASAPAPVAAPTPTPTPTPTPLPVVVSAPPVAAAPAVPAAPASAVERALRFTELSPELQRQMPPLVPSGSVWSDQPASRFVLINGQVVREGDTVAPGLVLERLQPKAALLRWRGLLIELPL